MAESKVTIKVGDWPEVTATLKRASDRIDELEAALDDLLNWAEHREGDGRLRRTEALTKAREALAGGLRNAVKRYLMQQAVLDSLIRDENERWATFKNRYGSNDLGAVNMAGFIDGLKRARTVIFDESPDAPGHEIDAIGPEPGE